MSRRPRYVGFALVAFAAYSLVAPLVRLAMAEIPSPTAVFLSNTVLVLVVGALLVVRGDPVLPYLSHPARRYLLVMAALLTVGLLSYYRALALGPVSVVVPIYGLFIVVSSVAGIVVFDEAVTRRKVGGLICSVLAILLISL